MAEEMRTHIERRTQANLAAGMSPDDARFAARRQFGRVEQIQELARVQRGWGRLEDLLQDLRVGVRLLWKERGFTAVAVFVLALAIGAVATQFSIVDTAVLRGLPFRDPERLVSIAVRDPAWSPERTRAPWIPDVIAFAGRQESFTGLAQYLYAGSFIVTIGDLPQRYSGSHITHNFFTLLGVKPALGRDFNEADDRFDAERVTIISDGMWQADFGGDPDILGRKIRVNGRTATVIGVMPPRFTFPRDQLWLPFFNEIPDDGSRQWSANVLGRLKPGFPIERATAEWEVFLQAMAQEYPQTNANLTDARIDPLLNVFVGQSLRRMLGAMLAAVGAVLMIACANVMNLQFARASVRARELSVRGALGASRGRLVRQMLTESSLLALLGAGGGVMLAYATTGLLRPAVLAGLPPGVQPSWWQFAVDARVLGFTAGIAVVTVMFSGLVPALLATRGSLAGSLKDGARGQTGALVRGTMNALVVGQIALTCALLICALLLVRSIAKQFTVDLGFDSDAVMCGRMNLGSEYPDSIEARRAVFRKLLAQLRGNPHFEAAALTTRRNLLTTDLRGFEIEGRTYSTPEERPEAWSEIVSDGYFATLGLRPLSGREFEPTDGQEGRGTALVNESFARKYFGSENPIGRRLRDNERTPWRVIVGVVPDTLMQGPLEARRDGAGCFVPVEEFAPPYISLVARGRSPARQLADEMRREVSRVNPNLALYLLNTARGHMGLVLAEGRMVVALFAAFGGVSIVLAAVGLYGVMSFGVNRRRQEFGVRIALGAQARQITGMVLAQAGRQLAIGVGLGLLAAIGLMYFGGAAASAYLYKVSLYDPLVYAAVLTLLAIATLLACWLPARRASRVDPMVALRVE